MIIRAFIVIPIILILLYLVINYFFVKSTTLTKLQSAKETQIIKASTIPNNHNTNNYAYSMWFYVDDWDYRLGEPKVLLSRGNSCDKDSSCDTNNCIDGVCVKPRRCYKTKDCEGSKGKDWYCHNEWCYQKCYSNDDPHHANGTCLWNNGNIPTGKQCNRHKDSDCESNNCLNGVCATPRKCDSSPQCVKHVGKDWYCSNGLCYQSCYSNNDPRNDKGVCIWNKGNIPTGKQCNRHKDSDCESNNCIDGVCASRRICTSGAQCWNRIGAGWWCNKKSDSKTGRCIQECNSDRKTPRLEGVCLWNNGNIPTGKQCNRQKDSDCDSNNCLNGVCANPRKCDSSPQCVKHVGAGWWCNKKSDSKTGTCLQECNSNEDPRNNEGECLWNKGNIPNRKQCNRHRNNDCESNNCINGICWDKKNTEYTPIGCYHDRPSRALPKQLGNTGTKTDFAHAGKICAKKANDKGYKYFGLQYPPGNTQCWVGNDLTHAKKYGKTECGLGGAAWKNFIYSTPMKPATSNVYAVNKANEIYAKNPRGSEENWYQPNPSAHLSNVSATGKTNIWGVGSDHQVWKCKRPC